LFVVLLITAPSYLEVGASDKPGAVQVEMPEKQHSRTACVNLYEGNNFFFMPLTDPQA